MEHVRNLGYHEKNKPVNMGAEEGDEIQTKDIDNSFSGILAQNFSNLEKERESHMCRKLTEHKSIQTKKETPPDTS
jgi:hypothetical protein